MRSLRGITKALFQRGAPAVLAAALLWPLGCRPTTSSSSSSGGCGTGAEGCSCRPDVTCDAPLRCVSGRCQQPAPGSLGGACSAGMPCSADAVWGQLQCVAGTCQTGACQPGTLGCSCGPGGACEPFGVLAAVCLDVTCVLAGCTAEQAGQPGCQCNNGSCAGSAQCVHGACRENAAVGVVVTQPMARSCDVLLRVVGDSRVRTVHFSAGVRGKEIQRGQTLALAFMAQQDVAFQGRLAALDVFPVPVGGGRGVEVASAVCADATGQPLAESGLRLE